LLRSLAGFCALIETPGGRSELHELVRTRTATIGQEITVDLAGQQLRGKAVDVLGDGRLLVATADGEVAVTAGDIRHVRRQD
jgi:BirA family biotin operon repressor/biotin-[acetyl-CoA-carboxylase] ligase